MNINSLDFVYCIFQEEPELNKTMGAKTRYHRKIKNGKSFHEVLLWSSNGKNNINSYSFDADDLDNFKELLGDLEFPLFDLNMTF
jgi:hypothetical protein